MHDQAEQVRRVRRDQLVTTHVVVVHAIVREVAARVPTSVDRSDLTSAGLLALVKAADSYDADRGVPFAAYARTRIRGALLDELRSQDWASRTVRRTARQIEEVRNRMAAALGQVPDPGAVAAALGVDVAVVHRSSEDLARAVVLSIDDELGGGLASVVPTAGHGPEGAYELREGLELVADAIAELPERLQLVIRGFFLEDRPMADIAADLGVSESRVSQLRAEALVLMRSAFERADPDLAVAPAPGRPGGVAARRRASYAAAVVDRNAMRRLPSRPTPGRRDVVA